MCSISLLALISCFFGKKCKKKQQTKNVAILTIHLESIRMNWMRMSHISACYVQSRSASPKNHQIFQTKTLCESRGMLVFFCVFLNKNDKMEVELHLKTFVFFDRFIDSGQIIATSHGSLTPKGSFLEGKWDPLFQAYLGWWNIIIWPDRFGRNNKLESRIFLDGHVELKTRAYR